MEMSRLIRGMLVLWGLFVFGCGTSGVHQQQTTFNTVQKGHVSPYTDNQAPMVSVLEDQAAWTDFWNVLRTSYTEKPPLPPVDFSDSVVIAVVDTPRPSDGFSVAITRVETTPSGVTVHTSAVSPGPGCLVPSVFTQPFHIVTVPPFTGEATVELSQSVTNCE